MLKLLLTFLVISSCVAKPLHREYCYLKQANFDCKKFNVIPI
jgi:hypothetical protein